MINKIILLCAAILLSSGCFIVNYPEMVQEKQRLERGQSFERGKYEDQIEQYKNQVVELNRQIDNQISQLDELRTRYDDETSRLQERLDITQMEKERVIENLQNEIQSYRSDYDQIVREYEEKEEELIQLEMQIQQEKHQLEIHRQKVAHYEEELSKFRTGYDDIYEEFNKVIDEYEELIEENEALEEKVYTLQQQIYEKEKEISEMHVQLDQKEIELSQVQEHLQQKEKEMEDAIARLDDRDKPVFNFDSETVALQEALQNISREIEVSRTPYSIRVLIPGHKLFTVGTAQIEAHSHSTLNRVAAVLKNYEQDFYFFVEGHTDALPLVNAPFPSNWELSAARATNLVRYFISETQINPDSLVALACSSLRPISDVLEKNRRVEVVLIPRELYIFN